MIMNIILNLNIKYMKRKYDLENGKYKLYI